MPGLFNQVVTDLNRFMPDATRMAVLEARPLFLYTGNWTWSQPWMFFRSGFYVGLRRGAGAGVCDVAIAARRSHPDSLLHRRQLSGDVRAKPLRLLPRAVDGGGDRVAGRPGPRLGRRAACG